MKGELDGQVVIITGASSGIGAAAARKLTRAGAHVVLAARRLERLDALKREIEAAGGRADVVAADITASADRARLVQTALQINGRIDALVNNAGYGTRGPVELVPVEKIRQNFEVNLFAPVFANFTGRYKRATRLAGQPEEIAALIHEALAVHRPRTRYAAPRHARLALVLKRFLPERWFDYILDRQSGMKAEGRKQ